MKKTISRSRYSFLQQEMSQFERDGIISSEQRQKILSHYEVKASISIIWLLFTIGAIFIGISAFIFVTENWDFLTRAVKLSLIFIGLIGFYLVGWKLEHSYPFTSRCMYYIGVFIFGAGLQQIEKMFDPGVESQTTILAWIIGILPLIVYLRDHWLAYFTILLLFLYTENSIHHYPYALLVILPLLYWINDQKLRKYNLLFFLLNLLSLRLIQITMSTWEIEDQWINALFLVVGIGLIYLPFQRYGKVLEWQGSLVVAITALFFLHQPFLQEWSLLQTFGNPTSLGIIIFFAILYTSFGVYLLHRGKLAATLILLSVITGMNQHFIQDSFVKLFFFLIVGILLIAYGVWYEKKRRGGAKNDGEKISE